MARTDVEGVEIHYTDSGGPGTPALLLHAFPLNSRMWAPQIDALGEDHRLIAVDFKGFGDSDAPEDAASYTMDSYAAEVKGVLDVLGIERAVLVGLSMGGYVSFAFLRNYPDTVAGLLLADTRSEADAPEQVERRTEQQAIVAEQGPRALVDGFIGIVLSEHTRSEKPDIVATVRALMDNPTAGYIGALEALKKRADSSGELAAIDVPTTFVVGEHDALTPPEVARRMHEHVRGSRLAVVPEAGHLSSLEDADAFNEALADLLARL